MEKEEGFVIDLNDIPVEDIEDKKETVEVTPPEKKVEKPADKTDETVVVEEEDDGLITVDEGPLPKEEEEEKEKEPEKEEKKEKEPEKEEKEEKEEDKEDNSKDGEDADDSQETESPSFLHATALKDTGVLPTLDLKELEGKSDEEIIKATILGTQDEIERTVKEIVGQQDQVYQQFIEVLNSGGDLDEYAKIKASQQKFEGITAESLDEDEDLQKALLTEDMKERGYDKDDILESIDEFAEKEGKLLSKAKPALSRLKKREKDREAAYVQKTNDDAKARQDERVATLKKVDVALDGLKEIIPGIPVAMKDRVVMKKIMTEPVEYQDGVPISRAQQLRAQDPVAYEMKLSYCVALGLLGPDSLSAWDKVRKKATTDAAKKIVKKLGAKQKHTPGKSPAKKTTTDDDVFIMPSNM